MLKAALTSMLILLLTCSAQAGYMQTGGSPEPPPPPSDPAVCETTDASLMARADGVTQFEESSALTQVTLELLAALPLLF